MRKTKHLLFMTSIRRRVGLFLIQCHNLLCMHVYKELISVSESSLLIMAFEVCHKLSGVALEDFLLGADSPSLPKV